MPTSKKFQESSQDSSPVAFARSMPLPIRIELKAVYIVPSNQTHKRIVDLFDAFKYDITNADHGFGYYKISPINTSADSGGVPLNGMNSSRAQLLFYLYMLYPPWSNTLNNFKGRYRADACKRKARFLKEHHRLDPFYKNLSETEIYKNLLKANSEDEERWRIVQRRN